MEKVKLFKKISKRVGMIVFEKESIKMGRIIGFEIDESKENEYSVYYIVKFQEATHAVVRRVHESNLILMKETNA